jgi:hypothetical protein
MDDKERSVMLEELFLPLLLLWQFLARKIAFPIAWSILPSWWPCKKYRRLRMRFKVWRDRLYDGYDEFHPSLSLDVASMLEMTEDEQAEYLVDLQLRRSWARLDVTLHRASPEMLPLERSSIRGTLRAP